MFDAPNEVDNGDINDYSCDVLSLFVSSQLIWINKLDVAYSL